MLKRNREALYFGEDIFFDRMMSDWNIRTLDMRQASLFYVPVWAVHHLNNIAFVKNFYHYQSLVNWTQTDADFRATWAGGANAASHVFWFAGDKGACLLPRGPIFIAHWGLSVPWKYMIHVPESWRADAVERRAHRTNNRVDDFAEAPCADDLTIIAPPMCKSTSCKEPTAYQPALMRAKPSYDYELLFAGMPTFVNRSSSFCLNPNSPGALLFEDTQMPPRAKGSFQRCYSQGVRELEFWHHANRSRFLIARRANDTAFSRSRFCLAPSGEGFGDRIAKSMLLGCVPLIIQPNVRQPLDDVLPYADFSLRMEIRDIPHLHELLPRVSESEHARLLRGVASYAAAFDWTHKGKAYEYVRYLLCLRAHRAVSGASADSWCAHLAPNTTHAHSTHRT